MVDGVKDQEEIPLDIEQYEKDFPRLEQMQQQIPVLPEEPRDIFVEGMPAPIIPAPTGYRSILVYDKVFPAIELDRYEDYEIVAEVIVSTDKQRNYLGGDRTFFESLSADAFVDVAVRDTSVDLFGFTLDYSFHQAVEDYREGKDHEVFLIDPGDVADSGCVQEMYLAWHKDVYPDHLGKGNHDVTHKGNLNDDDDAWGAMSHFLGKTPYNDWTYETEIWGKRCSGPEYRLTAEVHGELSLKYVYGFEDGEPPWIHLKRIGRKRAVIIDEDGKEKVKWGAVRDADLIFGEETDLPPVVSDVNKLFNPTVEMALDDAVRVYEQFWREAPKGQDVCFIKLEGQNVDEERSTIEMSAQRLSEDMWYINFDAMDMTKTNRLIPGIQGTISYAQAYLAQAYIGYVRSQINPDAIFVDSRHFKWPDIYNPILPGSGRAWKKSDMAQLLSHWQMLNGFSGHGHQRGIYIPNEEFEADKSGIRRDPDVYPYYDFNSPSMIDHPIEGMRVVYVKVQTENGPAIVPILDYIPIKSQALDYIPPEAEEEFKLHRNQLGSYRNVKIDDPRIREILHAEGLPKYIKGVGYLIKPKKDGKSTHWEVNWHDTIPLMVYQYFEIIKYTLSVIKLLSNELEGREDRDYLETVIRELRSHVREMQVRFDLWHENKYLPAKEAHQEFEEHNAVYKDSQEWRDERAEKYRHFEELTKVALSLTNSDCPTPHNHEFAGDDVYYGCIGKLQLALQDIPQETAAYKFMFLMALEGSEADYMARHAAVKRFEPEAIPLVEEEKKRGPLDFLNPFQKK